MDIVSPRDEITVWLLTRWKLKIKNPNHELELPHSCTISLLVIKYPLSTLLSPR